MFSIVKIRILNLVKKFTYVVMEFDVVIYSQYNFLSTELKHFGMWQWIFQVSIFGSSSDQELVLKMYLVQDKGGAIALMLAALLFLGTWPAVLTLLERRGRLPQHTYLDYSITNLLAAVIIALTLGQIGDSTPEMPNFITQLGQVISCPLVLVDILFFFS